MKKCPKCKQDKPVEEFAVNRSRIDGRASTCKLCHRDYCRSHYENNKDYYLVKNNKRVEEIRQLIRHSKKEAKCSKCGYERCTQALHFHHLDSDQKDRTISDLVNSGWSDERILQEIDKCTILCANCHTEEHYCKVM